MINTRISADWSTTKPIAAFSCTPCVQEVHTKSEGEIGKEDLCMILGPKVGVLPSFVAKIVGNNYCTETSVQPATVEVREYSTRVCSFREPE